MQTTRPTRANQGNTNGQWPGKTYFLILFVTIALIIALTLSLALVLFIDDGDSKGPNDDDIPNGDNTPIVRVGQKTGMRLPSITVGGSFLSSSAAGVRTISGISCEAAILVDVDSNVSVAEKNADTVVHPASLSKVMTLLVACENAADPNALLTVKQDMLDRRTELGGSGQLVDNASVLDGNDDSLVISIVGMSVTLEDALYLINYKSDTVACLLVAEYIAGSESAFVSMMNAKARELGLTSTTFVNATGLTEKSGQYNRTTAREMAAIMACALNNEVARTVISATDKYKADVYENGRKTEYYIPFFADWYNKEARLNGKTSAGTVTIRGGKTGYEDIPTSCFVTYGTSSNGKTYVCVAIGKLIGSDGKNVNNSTNTADTRTIYKNYAS